MEKAYYTKDYGKTVLDTDIKVHGSGTILLVDDDFFIRITSERLLENLGYSIIPAIDGIEALKIYQQQSSEIDLIILDMVMPIMRGDEVFRKLRQINPECKVILMSGIIKKPQLHELLHEGASGFISKPFDVATMSTLIHKVIMNKV